MSKILRNPNIPERFITGLSQGQYIYTIHGVRYIVESKFEHPKTGTGIADRFRHCITSDFTDLTDLVEPDTMDMENVCSAADKEVS